MDPAAFHALAGNPESEMVVLAVWTENLTGCLARRDDAAGVGLLVGIEVVAFAKLEKLQVGQLTVCIMTDAFETSEEQCLAHHAQILAQRVDESHEVLRLVGLAVVVIGCLGE